MAQKLSEIKEILESAGLRPQKSFGQNFLIDHNLLAKIVRFAKLPESAAVLEIGPGTGTLTDELLDAGANVLAIEIDRGLAAVVAGRYAGNDNFRLINCDVMGSKSSIAAEVVAAARKHAENSPDGKLRLVSNLPYNITTPLVCEFLTLAWQYHCSEAADDQKAGLPLTEITATVQAEAAERISANIDKPKDYGPASILVNTLAEVQLGKVLPPQAFWPAPKVTSRIIRINFDPKNYAPKGLLSFKKMLSVAFSQRRKKISSACNSRNAIIDKDLWLKALAGASIDPNKRPQQIRIEEFAALAQCLDL